jgi:hypothetical protein
VNILVTPDFGRSDAWDFSFATKFLLAGALREGHLPLWTRLIGGGFPLVGEGQIGAFFLPNLLAFGLLPAALAYNLTLLFALLTAASGMYVFVRRLRLGRLASLFAAISFALSGIFIPQLTHHTLIQGISLLPWIMVATTLLIEKFSWRRVVLWSVLVSQQIFTGFPQAVFITLLFAFGWTLWHKKYFLLLGPFLLALALGAVQLLPSYEFLTQSNAEGGFSASDATYFSYPPKHLQTFIQPFLLGNPAVGTYPHFSQFDGSIFWENTGFFGTIGLLLAVAGAALAITKRMRVHQFFLWSAAAGLLFMMGTHSPLYVIFSFWPFTLFRVPSRFLWVFVFSLIPLAAYALQRLLSQKSVWKTFAYVLIAANCIQLVYVWSGYHAWGDEKAWFTAPAIAAFLPPGARIHTVGATVAHNRTFLVNGWKDMTKYFRLRGALAPDGNVIWGVASADVYAGRQLRRQGIFGALLTTGVQTDEHVATISATGTQLMQIAGVTHVISALPLASPVGEQQLGDGDITLHKLPNPGLRTYIAEAIRKADTVTEASRILTSGDFLPGSSVLLSANDAAGHEPATGSAKLVSETDTSVVISTMTQGEGVLVLADTYYPGWRAFVDEVPTRIFPANIYQRAVIVPGGVHTITFRYQPESLALGTGISITALILTAYLAVSRRPFARFRIG